MSCTKATGHHAGPDKLCCGLEGVLMLQMLFFLLCLQTLNCWEGTTTPFVLRVILLSFWRNPDKLDLSTYSVGMNICRHTPHLWLSSLDLILFSPKASVWFLWRYPSCTLPSQISAPCPSPPTPRSSNRICRSCLSRWAPEHMKLLSCQTGSDLCCSTLNRVLLGELPLLKGKVQLKTKKCCRPQNSSGALGQNSVAAFP